MVIPSGTDTANPPPYLRPRRFPGIMKVVDLRLKKVKYLVYDPGRTTVTTLTRHQNGFAIIKPPIESIVF